MAVKPKTETEDAIEDVGPVLYRICRELLEQHDNVKLAAEHLMARALKDKELHDILMKGALEQRCAAAIRHVSAQQRRNVWRRTAVEGAKQQAIGRLSGDTMAAWAENVRAGLLDTFRLPDGSPLRTATREQVVASAELYRRQAGTLAGYAVFLDHVAQTLQPGEVVGARIDDKRAAELQQLALSDYDDDTSSE